MAFIGKLPFCLDVNKKGQIIPTMYAGILKEDKKKREQAKLNALDVFYHGDLQCQRIVNLYNYISRILFQKRELVKSLTLWPEML